jgi:hypothetical protein
MEALTEHWSPYRSVGEFTKTPFSVLSHKQSLRCLLYVVAGGSEVNRGLLFGLERFPYLVAPGPKRDKLFGMIKRTTNSTTRLSIYPSFISVVFLTPPPSGPTKRRRFFANDALPFLCRHLFSYRLGPTPSRCARLCLRPVAFPIYGR